MQCMTLYRLVEAQVILRKWKSRGNTRSPTSLSYIVPAGKHLQIFHLLGKGADDFGGDVEEEYGRDERE
jgi:hypothetical protein